MTKEKEDGDEEEEETASEDEEEYYVEAWKYNEIMEFLSDDQLLKTMLNIGFYIPHGVLNFRNKLFVGKYVIDIRPFNVSVIDEFGF